MKAAEFRDKTEVELEQEMLRLASELFRAKVAHSGGRLRDYHNLCRLRRDIARVQTVQRERELSTADVGEADDKSQKPEQQQ